MIIPWSVDVPQERRPFVNYLIVVLMILAFMWKITSPQEAIEPYMLEEFSIQGLFGHMWLHADVLHIIGNLLFVWIFGNAVCAKIGNLLYFAVYIGFGLLSGMIQLFITGGPILGASGAICGVVGMYLVFFCENEITCYFVWLPFVREFSVRSFWMILFWMFFDIVGVLRGGGGVAFFAHLTGYAAGFGAAVGLLKTGMITMEEYEKSLLELFGERKKRRGDSEKHFDKYSLDLEYLKYLEAKERQKAADSVKTAQKSGRREIGNYTTANMPDSYPLGQQSDGLIRFTCSCGQRFKVSREHAGKTGKCSKCGSKIKIPQIF